jgi:hypothetical protein
MHSTLAWWIAGPILGLVIVGFLGLANKRFGVVGGVTDLVEGSAEGRGLAQLADAARARDRHRRRRLRAARGRT